jgi:uncharacterized membrane protein YphA (DoxX/SURF4 family)
MKISISQSELGYHVLRLGLAAVFLWFGFSQLIDSLIWVSVVPEWASDLLNMPPAMIVMVNGALEILLGSLLALGFFVRPAAAILAVHLLVIAIDFGFSAVGVRDFGLVFATSALALMSISVQHTQGETGEDSKK